MEKVKDSHKISVIVPLFNERDNVVELIDSVGESFVGSDVEFELLLVNDGSDDGTSELLERLGRDRPYLRVIELRRNFGQTAALAAGFDHASGDVIVPMDGDLQNDPADILRLVAKLDTGYDVVSGWRRRRKDMLIRRRLPSWLANRLIGFITGVRLHDFGCTLKAYRRELLKHMNLYGEMHRFIPAIAQRYGARVTELEVNHRERKHGRTKYGLSRTFKVVFDLVTVKFLGEFGTKPLHIFGSIGLVTGLGAMASGLVVLYQKFSDRQVDMSDSPLPLLTVLLLMMSVQFLLMGLLAEMMARTYHESQNKPTYVVRRILGRGDSGGASVDQGRLDV